MRFSLFQLMASVPTDGEAAVGARGVSGPSYRGHVFWDADVFALPFFAATCPPAARAMLEYRLRRLGPAYRAAAERGLRGARFPWESARGGEDVTPRWDRPPHGPPIRIYTGEHEEHIVADVAWAAWQYAAWTGDDAFLQGAGRAAAPRHRSVLGLQDQGRRGRPGAHRRRHRAGRVPRARRRQRLHQRDGALEPASCGRAGPGRTRPRRRGAGGDRPVAPPGRRRSSTTTTPTRAGTSNSAGMHSSSRWSSATCHGTVAADLLLGRERIGRSQIIKQPDVLMLHHLVPEETGAGLAAAEPGVLRATLRPRQFLVARRARGVVRPRRPPRRRPRALPPGVPARPRRPHRAPPPAGLHVADVRRPLAGPGLRLPRPATAPPRAARRPPDPRSLAAAADEAAVPRRATGHPGLAGRRLHHAATPPSMSSCLDEPGTAAVPAVRVVPGGRAAGGAPATPDGSCE